MTKWYMSLLNGKKLLSLIVSPKTYTEISNWPLFFADHLGLVQDEYTLLFRNHLKLILRANHKVKWPIQEVFLKDDYRLISLRKHPPTTIIDLGACIGMFSLFAKALFPNAQVYAYEPLAEYFLGLQRNINLNNFRDSIFPFPLACYSPEAIRQLKKGRIRQFSKLKGPKCVYAFKQAISLSDILEQNKIRVCDLLKIDVEGAEYDILYSLPPKQYKHIRRIHLEYHNMNPETDLNGSSLKLFLEKNHFNVIHTNLPFQPTGMIYATNQVASAL